MMPGDLLEGAAAIAEYMTSLGGRWTRKRVYYLVETGGWPIWHQKGIGLVARKSVIAAYMAEREREAMSRGPRDSASAA
jgi:hypothetical protein